MSKPTATPVRTGTARHVAQAIELRGNRDPSPPQPGVFDAALSSIAGAKDRVNALNQQCESIADRVLGSQPETRDEANLVSEADSLSGRLANALESLHGSLSVLESRLQRLEAL